MTHRNNTRFNVVFLVMIVFSLMLACTLPDGNRRTNQSSANNEDNEANNPRPTDTSLPTQTAATPPIPTKTQAPLPTKTDIPTETLLPSPTATVDGVYYFNNFDHQENTGRISRGEGISTEILDGELNIQLTVPLQAYSVVLTEQEFTNVMVTGWAKFEGQENASIGLFCQSTIENDIYYHYVFLISRSGSYSLDYRSSPDDGDIEIIRTLAQGQSDVLFEPGPNVWNGVQIICVDQRLMFFVNGELLVDVSIEQPVLPGLVGLAQYNPAGTDYLNVTWDMLSVNRP